MCAGPPCNRDRCHSQTSWIVRFFQCARGSMSMALDESVAEALRRPFIVPARAERKLTGKNREQSHPLALDSDGNHNGAEWNRAVDWKHPDVAGPPPLRCDGAVKAPAGRNHRSVVQGNALRFGVCCWCPGSMFRPDHIFFKILRAATQLEFPSPMLRHLRGQTFLFFCRSQGPVFQFTRLTQKLYLRFIHLEA